MLGGSRSVVASTDARSVESLKIESRHHTFSKYPCFPDEKSFRRALQGNAVFVNVTQGGARGRACRWAGIRSPFRGKSRMGYPDKDKVSGTIAIQFWPLARHIDIQPHVFSLFALKEHTDEFLVPRYWSLALFLLIWTQ